MSDDQPLPEETSLAQTTDATDPASTTTETSDPAKEGAVQDEASKTTAPSTNNKNGRDNTNNRYNNNKKKEDEVPIEDLFDLSKPIPKVDKPDKTEHEEALKALTDAVEALKNERNELQKEIEEAMADPESKTAVQSARSEFNTLKTQKGTLFNEKKEMFAQLEQIKNQADKAIKDKNDTRSNVRFNSLKEIEDEIVKLKRKQETTTMSLNEEKKLIKEMEALQGSKKFVADLKDKDAAIESVKEQRKSISTKIDAKEKEIKEISGKMDKIMVTLKAFNEKDTKKREELQGLFKKRDALKVQVGEKLKELNALRDDFREKSNNHYNYQRAIRAQKKMAYEEEKKKREEEKAAHQAKLAEEEAKKIPYEEEQALCDHLADYLERTYLGVGDKNGETEKKDDIVEVKDDPFAGLKPVNKKSDDEYFGKGKGKKKRTRAAKKQDSTGGPFTLSVDTFEQFGLLGLSPPISVEQVENSVKELRERKEWYKAQPRGSVPTATEIRKAKEKTAAKLRNTDSNESEVVKNQKNPGNFSLSNDDFAPLGEGPASSSVNSSWGQQKSVSTSVPSEADFPEPPTAEASS